MKTPSPFPPFDSDQQDDDGVKHRSIPLRFVVPNIITTMAIVAGLSSIRMGLDGRFDVAVIMLLIAAFLDGMDGRVARAIKGSSRFGEQLDSLADAINFGVVPAFLAYIFILDKMGDIGWLAALVYAVACCLRLARFNVMLEDKNRPQWQKNYFVGIPSPAGGVALLLPVYLSHLGMEIDDWMAGIFCIYTLLVALLMVSNLPVWNGKSVSAGLRRDIVVPVLLVVVVYLVLLVSYMWQTLAISCLVYLALLPVSAWVYHRRVRYEAKQEQ
ncbi:MAG: CDP-diacylglycerol--serine O-phosphatidyltransferase [Candidatus Tokpelaia hoelldobleri]|uniref:CDP-diacylglycerol--serine O-phosphatidyltransferase n=1 Tax=Candidatus Tokpelaia hoelldobleri TaxID=1902579 RepID=A0A1U9JVM6_9HYPH|nr:MAG: CDP-diacylglycerol--serine O-phosphatidyltransferase [Candidatus Tokpelaia hoelldoblerii]